MKHEKYLIVFLCTLFACSFCLAGGERTEFEEEYAAGDEFSLRLNIDGAELSVKKNDRNLCYVYIEYDKKNCHVQSDFNKEQGKLEIEVDHDNWEITKRGHDDGDKYAKVTIGLPERAIIDLTTKIKAGKIDMDLGDLNIRDFKLRSWAGEATIDYSEPNRIKMGTFDVDFKVGEVDLISLGNANFEEADINASVGEMTVDFRGGKLERAMARIDIEIGETTVIVPRDIGTKIKVSKFLFLSSVEYPDWFDKRGNYYYSRNYREEEKSLYLMVSTGIGELNLIVK